MKSKHTIAYSKSHRDGHLDLRGRIDDTANTLSCGDGCSNQSTQNFVFYTEDEEWKPVIGYEGYYEISSRGSLRSCTRTVKVEWNGGVPYDKVINSKELSQDRMHDGYLRSSLYKDTVVEKILSHRLVCEAFHGPAPEGKTQVNHKNGIKDDNRAINLEWCTQSENMQHAVNTGLHRGPKGEVNGKSKLNESDVRAIVVRLDAGETSRSISKDYEVGEAAITCIDGGDSWNHITGRKDMTDIKLIAGETAPNQSRKSLYKQTGRVYDPEGITPTVTTESTKNAHIPETNETIRIRKLTPLECERCMGWPDQWSKYGVDDKGVTYEVSNSARYKACGNGIVPTIPKALLDKLTGEETELRVFSTFAGVDGSGMLLDSPKYIKVGFSEHDPSVKLQTAANILRYHYPTVPNFGDITKLDIKDVPDHDIIFISCPCQSFSSAGHNLGIEDTRGTLFYETARIIQGKKPKYFIFENVKGLLTKTHDKTFETMCEVYSSLGYELDFELLNAKYWGVPQNRERVFMLGRRLV